MKKYEYKFIEVTRQRKKGATMKICQDIIVAEAEKGWRLSQLVQEFKEPMNVNVPAGYQIILEREV